MAIKDREIRATRAPRLGAARVSHVLRPVGHFVGHFAEMCIAMCIGLAVLDLLYLGVARLAGYAEPFSQLPELSTLIIAFNMTVPMVAWMRFRGMAWRPINEMSAAMVVEAAVLIGLYWLSIIPAKGLFPLQHGLMMPAMLVPMFLRLDLYTGKAGHHARAA